jgi:hypothetical protein
VGAEAEGSAVAASEPEVAASGPFVAASQPVTGVMRSAVDSVGLGDRRGGDECKGLLESEQWLAL